VGVLCCAILVELEKVLATVNWKSSVNIPSVDRVPLSR